MHIGIILKSDKTAEELGKDWVPPPLGSKSWVYECLAEVLNQSVVEDEIAYTTRDGTVLHFTVAAEDEPRAVSVSYGSSQEGLDILRAICKRLDAKFYDSEMCGFIDI